RLPKEKQDTLIQAAKKEFSRAPLHESSVANIVQEACIPRGSFYQYFEDKEDLFYYLLRLLSRKSKEQFISTLRKKGGDLFAAFTEVFQFAVQDIRNEENANFFKNAFSNMNYKTENTLAENFFEEDLKKQDLALLRSVNTKKLNIRDERDLQDMITILEAVTFHNLVQAFAGELTAEEALGQYLAQMELLKKGLYRQPSP
ncbi:TetR/AcrR family transcriptional regulator, partial [Kitasatospora sp. SC0581]|uniref:TetR/AcrR family transcriptional regulator n=1 Tax=Kitasatospora sp. SC0581 TaxID=3394360 RepID=UPI003A8B4E14